MSTRKEKVVDRSWFTVLVGIGVGVGGTDRSMCLSVRVGKTEVGVQSRGKQQMMQVVGGSWITKRVSQAKRR